MLATRTSPAATAPDRPSGLSALRGIEVAELLRVVATLHLEGLLTDAEYQVTRQRLVAQH